ncbi:MAG: DUF1636 family protein [Rhodobacteraceae bacterium]|nr:DUF1636 family protein [Paracoccaceae bacterium]
MTARMTICGGCAKGAEEAAAMLRPYVVGLAEVAVTDCMNICDRPVSVSVREEGKAAYLFAGVDVVAQAEELAAFARLYAAAPGGIIEDARSCGALRYCLVGRIPG